MVRECTFAGGASLSDPVVAEKPTCLLNLGLPSLLYALDQSDLGLGTGVPQFDQNGDIRMITETTHTGGDWLAAMTFLERRHPERWARPAVGSQGQGGGNTYNINIEKAIIDAAGKFDAVISRLAARAATPLAIPESAVTHDVEPENTIIEGGTEDV